MSPRAFVSLTRSLDMDCNVVGWCALRPEVQAAWVQAIFSVVGIGVAIAIPAIQHRRDRRAKAAQELKQARALSLSLMPVLNYWIGALCYYEGRLNRLLELDHPSATSWRPIADGLQLGRQGNRLVTQTHRMGSASSNAQKFFYKIAVAHEIARNNARSRVSPEQDRPRAQELLRVLGEARHAAFQTRDAAHRMLSRE